MNYFSTRNSRIDKTFDQIIIEGLSADGGLFMPEKWPSFSHSDLKNMKELSYSKLASKIIKPFIKPFLDENDISRICTLGYFH